MTPLNVQGSSSSHGSGSFCQIPPTPTPWYQSIPSALLQDSVQYIHVGRWRTCGRLIMVILAFAALCGLTAARYVSSDDIQAPVLLTRDYRPNIRPDTDLVKTTCPCQHPRISWGDVVKLDAATLAMWNIGDAGGKGTAFKLAQCSQITLRRNENLVRNTTVSQMRKDGFESTSDYKNITSDYRTVTRHAFCVELLEGIVRKFNLANDYADLSGTLDYSFTSLRLISEDELRATFTTLIGDMGKEARRSRFDALKSLEAVALAAAADPNATASEIQAYQKLADKAIRSAYSLYDPAYAVDGAAYIKETGSSKPGNFSQVNSLKDSLAGRVVSFLKDHVVFDFEAYKNACGASYCDTIVKKSSVDRVTEFLSTVGGLWTIVLAVAVLFWAALQLLPCLNSPPGSYEALHV